MDEGEGVDEGEHKHKHVSTESTNLQNGESVISIPCYTAID